MFENYIFPIILVAGFGLVFSVVLVIASKLMAVKTDERFAAVRAVLPGVNCGACGYAGCDDYAKALCEGAKTNLCTPGGDGVSAEISGVLGVEVADVIEEFAVVRCGGSPEVTSIKMDYKGVPTCAACSTFYQGKGSCPYSCMGYGDCVAVCLYDAIHVVDGVAVVDKLKCSGCGMCARQCPHHLIVLTDATQKTFVACSNKDKGAQTRKVCQVGCIACGRCAKVCPTGAITVADNLASIDSDKCTDCGLCVAECPVKTIRQYQV